MILYQLTPEGSTSSTTSFYTTGSDTISSTTTSSTSTSSITTSSTSTSAIVTSSATTSPAPTTTGAGFYLQVRATPVGLGKRDVVKYVSFDEVGNAIAVDENFAAQIFNGNDASFISNGMYVGTPWLANSPVQRTFNLPAGFHTWFFIGDVAQLQGTAGFCLYAPDFITAYVQPGDCENPVFLVRAPSPTSSSSTSTVTSTSSNSLTTSLTSESTLSTTDSTSSSSTTSSVSATATESSTFTSTASSSSTVESSSTGSTITASSTVGPETSTTSSMSSQSQTTSTLSSTGTVSSTEITTTSTTLTTSTTTTSGTATSSPFLIQVVAIPPANRRRDVLQVYVGFDGDAAIGTQDTGIAAVFFLDTSGRLTTDNGKQVGSLDTGNSRVFKFLSTPSGFTTWSFQSNIGQLAGADGFCLFDDGIYAWTDISTCPQPVLLVKGGMYI